MMLENLMRDFSVYAVVPARGGSKGIEGKNKEIVDGRPLVSRAVDSAMHSGIVDRVYVSSDDPEILALGTGCGAIEHSRPAYASTDDASTEAVIDSFLQWVGEEPPDFLVLIQPTNPFVTAMDIDNCLELLVNDPKLDATFTARSFHGFLWKNHNGEWAGVNHNNLVQRLRRQDKVTEEVLEDGGVYALRTSAFSVTGNRFGKKAMPVLSSSPWAPEVDTYTDLEVCRRLASYIEQTIRERG